MNFTKDEIEFLKEKNIFMTNMSDAMKEYLNKEGKGYEIQFKTSDEFKRKHGHGYIYDKVKELDSLIVDKLCICGVTFSSNDFYTCPICSNSKFKSQIISFELYMESLNKKEKMKNLKNKLFNDGYSYEKIDDSSYAIYRVKELFNYDWINKEFTYVNSEDKKLVGKIIKTKKEFYAIKDDKKMHIVNFVKLLKDNRLNDFIDVYNDLNKERPIPKLGDLKRTQLMMLILDDKLRIICEYFNKFISINVDRVLENSSHHASTFTEIYQYKYLTNKIEDNELLNKFQYPIDEKLYNIYTATSLPKSLIHFIKNEMQGAINSKLYFMIKLINIYKEEPNNAMNLCRHLKLIGQNDNSLQKFYSLLNRNNHEFKHLFNYLKEIKQKQGITYNDGLQYYLDYINASNELNVKYTKYPKNLLKVHDIRMKDFNLIKVEKNSKAFKTNYSKVVIKENVIDNYIFVSPKEAKDLTIEGQNLNHCVSSYVNHVVNNRSLIYFMRYKNLPNDSLITIEFNLSLNQIVQVRGKYNRNPNSIEKKAVKKWASKNGFIY